MFVPNLLLKVCAKIFSRVDARIGENVSVSPSYPDTPAAVVLILASSAVAIVTLPKGMKPAGCIAFLSSLM